MVVFGLLYLVGFCSDCVLMKVVKLVFFLCSSGMKLFFVSFVLWWLEMVILVGYFMFMLLLLVGKVCVGRFCILLLDLMLWICEY